jgi:hypothetical protein
MDAFWKEVENGTGNLFRRLLTMKGKAEEISIEIKRARREDENHLARGPLHRNL